MKAWGMIAFLFFAMSGPIYACSLTGVEGLPDSVVKQLELECEKAKEAANDATEAYKVEKLSAYAEVAMQIAKALGVAAQELGLAINDFLKSPAGLITAGVIIIKVLGPLIFSIMAAFFINIIGYKALSNLWHVEDGTQEITHPIFKTVKVVPVVRRISYRESSESQVGWSVLILAICVISWLIVPLVSR